MTDAPLKPCAHCGSETAPGVHLLQVGRTNYWSAYCNMTYGGCGAQTGQSQDKATAVDFWNRRTLPGMPGRDALIRSAEILEEDRCLEVCCNEQPIVAVAAWLRGLGEGRDG